jgi:hypothetical protein
MLNITIVTNFHFSYSRSLQEKLNETMDHLQQQVHVQTPVDHTTDTKHNRYEHERMHRTLDELIEQAAVKTRSAV